MWPALSRLTLMADTWKLHISLETTVKNSDFFWGKPWESPELYCEHQGVKQIPFPPWAPSSKTFKGVS